MMQRRDLIAGAAALPVAALLQQLVTAPAMGAVPAVTPAALASGTPFDPTTVRARARALAEQPYQAPAGHLPDSLKKLTYSQYRSIRFEPTMALWRGQGLHFAAEFFHRGFLYTNRVEIYEVADGRRRPIPTAATCSPSAR